MHRLRMSAEGLSASVPYTVFVREISKLTKVRERYQINHSPLFIRLVTLKFEPKSRSNPAVRSIARNKVL